jgi:RimJ/RimL family protein N-acetyltransferase
LLDRVRSKRWFEAERIDVLVWDATQDVRPPEPPPGLELRRIATDEDPWWSDSVIPADHLTFVGRFLARGDVGHVVFVDGEFAGWIWVSFAGYREPWSGLRIRIGPGESYSHSLWVAEAHRHRGAAALLVGAMLSELRQDPTISRMYGWVDVANRQSQMLLRMFGLRQAQKALRMGTLGIGWQLPFSARPRGGPLSALGRRSSPAVAARAPGDGSA